MTHRRPASPSALLRRRDESKDRVRRTARWVAAIGTGGTAVLIGVAAHEVPATSTTQKSPAASRTATTGSSGTQRSSSKGLSAPSSAPSASTASPTGGASTGGT